MNEHRRESRRWPYAFGALLGGTILGVLIVLAVRGPSVVVVNNGCCCGCETPCADPVAGKRLGATIPVLPRPERIPGPVTDPEPRPAPKDSRIAGLIPVIPWLNGGGGTTGETGTTGTTGETGQVPEPGVLALVAGGLLAWRLS